MNNKLHHILRQQLAPRQAFFLIGALLAVAYISGFIYILFTQYLPLTGNMAEDHSIIGRDFIAFWTAAHLMIEQSAVAVYNPILYAQKLQAEFGDAGRMLWSYPPFTLLFLWPLGFISYKAAFLVWLIISALLFVVACAPPQNRILFYLLICIVAPCISYGLFAGQAGLFISAILILGIRLSPKRPYLAGIIFSLMIIKIQLAIMIPIYLMATRNWRAMGTACISGLSIIGLSIVLFTSQPWLEYWTNMQNTVNYNLGTVFHPGMPTVYMFIIYCTHQSAPAILVQTLCSIMVAITSFRLIARTRNLPMQFVLFAAGTLLITPYAFVYDIPFLAAALICLIYSNDEPINWQKIVLYSLVWFLPIVQLVMPIGAIILLLFYIHVCRVILRHGGWNKENHLISA